MAVAVFHALIVIVDGNGENFLGVVLLDDVLVEIRFYHMRLVLGENAVECFDEAAVGCFGLLFFVIGDVAVYFFNAVAADGKACIRIEYRHVVLRMNGDGAVAETAYLLKFLILFAHVLIPFWKRQGRSLYNSIDDNNTYLYIINFSDLVSNAFNGYFVIDVL